MPHAAMAASWDYYCGDVGLTLCTNAVERFRSGHTCQRHGEGGQGQGHKGVRHVRSCRQGVLLAHKGCLFADKAALELPSEVVVLSVPPVAVSAHGDVATNEALRYARKGRHTIRGQDSTGQREAQMALATLLLQVSAMRISHRRVLYDAREGGWTVYHGRNNDWVGGEVQTASCSLAMWEML